MDANHYYAVDPIIPRALIISMKMMFNLDNGSIRFVILNIMTSERFSCASLNPILIYE